MINSNDISFYRIFLLIGRPVSGGVAAHHVSLVFREFDDVHEPQVVVDIPVLRLRPIREHHLLI